MSGERPAVPGEADCAPVSVIVITFNEEKNIRDCLDSLARQDYPKENYEVLVVDASTDATPEIAGSYGSVRVVKAPKGFSQQKNAGIKAARYGILAFTDADCVIPPDWLMSVNQAFKNPKLAVAGGNAYPPPGTRRFGLWSACVGHPAGGAVGFDANVTRKADGIEFAAGCNSAYRKSVLEDIGGFNPGFYDGGEDIEISRRLRQKGFPIDYIPELTVFHKPRATLHEYLKWNIGVGVTKFNIKQPSLVKIIFQPGFPLWSLVLLLGLFFLLRLPWLFLISLLMLWAAFLLILVLMTKPYPLLIKRRRRIGIALVSALTIIPILIYLRQICINIGQLKKWLFKRTSPVLGFSFFRNLR